MRAELRRSMARGWRARAYAQMVLIARWERRHGAEDRWEREWLERLREYLATETQRPVAGCYLRRFPRVCACTGEKVCVRHSEIDRIARLAEESE